MITLKLKSLKVLRLTYIILSKLKYIKIKDINNITFNNKKDLVLVDII